MPNGFRFNFNAITKGITMAKVLFFTATAAQYAALEAKDENHFLIGTQFHPELEDKYQILFDKLIIEAKKYKKLN